jgi:uncharacterized membrane protein
LVLVSVAVVQVALVRVVQVALVALVRVAQVALVFRKVSVSKPLKISPWQSLHPSQNEWNGPQSTTP